MELQAFEKKQPCCPNRVMTYLNEEKIHYVTYVGQNCRKSNSIDVSDAKLRNSNLKIHQQNSAAKLDLQNKSQSVLLIKKNDLTIYTGC